MMLNILGKILPSDKKAVAVVGTRMASERGREITEKFVKELVKKNITIISGLARGIDTIAHKTALKYGGRTIAIIGSGLDNIYPPENKNLALEIAKRGAIISPFPNGTKPLGKNFLARNELIAQMSKAVLVVEGKKKSGTISTANHAGNLGIEVFAIAGSEATNWLIDEGANPIQNPEEIIKYMNRISNY